MLGSFISWHCLSGVPGITGCLPCDLYNIRLCSMNAFSTEVINSTYQLVGLSKVDTNGVQPTTLQDSTDFDGLFV